MTHGVEITPVDDIFMLQVHGFFVNVSGKFVKVTASRRDLLELIDVIKEALDEKPKFQVEFSA